MCGIAGIVRLDGKDADQGDLDRLTDALAHRGPDGRGTWKHGNVGLGHRRLAIIDLTDAGAQPMRGNDDDVVLTFNGEIYDFAHHRSDLESKGHTFRSHSDTEVLLGLYREYGPECLQRLRGMFAFAIYDRKRGILFAARDRLGKKPFKYFQHAGVFAFASELKALQTLSQCPKGVDPAAIHHVLTMMYVPSPGTGIHGIRKLPAGHSLTLDLSSGACRIEPYWALHYRSSDATSQEEWERRVLATLEESVRIRMVADVPVGAFLSGGIDSAAIVALMSRNSSQPIKTFSIGSDDIATNELPDAQRIATAFGTDHHPIPLSADIIHLLPELVRTYEEPYADPSAIPTYLVARETRKHVTVALNGDGGDENFGGYVRYSIAPFSQWWSRFPSPLHAAVGLGCDLLHAVRPTTLTYRMQRFQRTISLPWEERYLQYISFFTEEEKRLIERRDAFPGVGRTDAWYAGITASARARGDDPVHKAMSMDLATYLPDCLMPKVDLGTMAHGLEARSPFLDHELLELTAQIPSSLKAQGRRRKIILKSLLRDILPAATLTKRKRGFRLPLDAWFRSELRPFVEDTLLSHDDPTFWRFFDRAGIERFLRGYYASQTDYSDHVWVLLWLREWLHQHTA